MNFASPETVNPISPAAGYQGGKRNLARRICAIIDRTPHEGYAEPFVGMGGIFLRRSTRPKVEVINDISGDVANFFRVLQEHYAYFIDHLRFRLASRNEFDRLNGMDPARMTDFNRAARFLYLQRLAFGGKIVGRGFGVDAGSSSRFNVTKLEPMLGEIHDRLAGVVIEQLGFDAFIPRYDRPGMLFYLDPPYFGCEKQYGADAFSRGDFERLAAILAAARGKFYLSLNDRPEVREIFAAFHFQAFETTYTIGTRHKRSGRVGEVLISNIAP